MRCRLLAYAALVVTAGGGSAIFGLHASAQPGFYDLASSDRSKAVNLSNQRSYASAIYKSKNFSEALDHWRFIVGGGSNEAYDHFWLGQSYYHLKRYTEAAGAFREAARLDKKLDHAKLKMVESYFASKNMPEVRNACAEVLPSVTDPYAKKQLEAMNKFATEKKPPPVFKYSGDIENPNNGKK